MLDTTNRKRLLQSDYIEFDYLFSYDGKLYTKLEYTNSICGIK